ncbi:hypothetical protein KY339_04840 [Candidatus Woesearchaeota archaeon]|nr:hypothetical protein [Candidatus Woesearchaeota archaeon]
MKKRGQVTIFIFVGVVLLILLALFIQLRGKVAEITRPEVIPEEFKPVKTFVETCMQETAADAISLLGSQGGYLYMPPEIANNPDSYISYGVVSPVKIPYWYYRDRNRVPPKTNMESDLSRYMNENLNACLRDFTAFEDKFEITPVGVMSTITTIARDNVYFSSTMPVDANLIGTNISATITLYNTQVPVKLEKIYEMAIEILESENELTYLENVTLDLMAAGPDIPFTDMLFECEESIWSKREVEDTIKEVLRIEIPRIQFLNTDYTPFAADDLYSQAHLYWDFTEEDYNDLTAGILFDESWRFKMAVHPSQGDLMKGSLGKSSYDLLRFLCLNVYHFTYDLVFPVEIMIRDDSAFGEEGFVFRYAIPVQINHNQGNRKAVSVGFFETPPPDKDFCRKLRTEETRIYVKDAVELHDIAGANVTFNCMDVYFCELGKTGFDAGVTRLRTNLPSFCRPGSIEAEKEGYLKSIISADEDILDLYLSPLKRLDFDVMKRRLTGSFLVEEQELDEGEQVAIRIFVQEDDRDYLRKEEYGMMRLYPYNETDPEELKTVDLISEETLYGLELFLLDNEDNIIGGFKGNWTLRRADLENKNKVTFRVMEKIPKPTSPDKIDDFLIFLSTNTSYNQQLVPVLKE